MNFPPIDQQLVAELRTKALNAIEDQGSEIADPLDVEKVRENDLWLWRFLVHQRRELSWSFDMLIECLKWRKEFGVNDITDSEFPQFFDDIGALYVCNKDNQGHRLLIMHVRRYRKEPIIANLTRRYFVNHLEKLEREDPTGRVSILFDMQGAGLANVDMDYLFFMFSCFKTYYPSAIASIYAYDMPWLFSAMWRVVKTWLNARATEKIKFVTKTNIQEFIDADELLMEFGGNVSPPREFVPVEHFLIKFKSRLRKNDADQNPYSRPTCEPPDRNDYIEVDGQILLKSQLEEMAQKKVQFVDTVGTCTDEHSSEDALDVSILSNDKSISQNLYDFDGLKTFLKISPSDELTFSLEDNECIATMKLDSNCRNTIAFKIKTTSPSKYRVRPSVGIIRPATSARIQITVLHNKSLGKCTLDKFLVVAMKVEDENVTLEELAALWQTAPPENRMEHKIRCSSMDFNRPMAIQNSNASIGRSSAAGGQLSLPSKVDKLLVQNVNLQREVRSLRNTFYCVLLIQVFLVIGLALLYHYDLMPSFVLTVYQKQGLEETCSTANQL